MSIRIRTVNGVRVALCAVESDPMPGDLYLDDGDHQALAAKFRRDWYGQTNDFPYPEQWAAMDTQKVRDAREEFAKWEAAGRPESCGARGYVGGPIETADELMVALNADERRTVYQTCTGSYSLDHGGNDAVERRAIDEALERGLIRPRWPDAHPEVQWWVRIDYVEERARKAKPQEPPHAS